MKRFLFHKGFDLLGGDIQDVRFSGLDFPYFRFIKPGTYIDIGCGMSALAGFASIDRPYHGSWINFRINNYNYGSVDKMDADNRNIRYLDKQT